MEGGDRDDEREDTDAVHVLEPEQLENIRVKNISSCVVVSTPSGHSGCNLS